MTNRLLFDTETNGLLPALDTIHCVVVKDLGTGETSTYSGHSIPDALSRLEDADVLVGHNIIDFDIPAIKQVYPDFSPRGIIRDTLTISRVVFADLRHWDMRSTSKYPGFPTRLIGSHGLEAWGHRLGFNKGDYSKDMQAKGLDPWENFNQDMLDYCINDVELNAGLLGRLLERWGADLVHNECFTLEHQVQTIINRQQKFGFAFDEAGAGELYGALMQRRGELDKKLQSTFPPHVIPTKSVDHWIDPVTRNTYQRKSEIKGKGSTVVKERVVVGAYRTKEIPFNPGSRHQITARLKEAHGWNPKLFTPDGSAKVDEEVLSSLPYPEAKLLSELFMLDKRIADLATGKKAWLKHIGRDGRIRGRVSTNGAVTGRMTHQIIVNVPSSRAPYGRECRSLFTVPPGARLVGADAEGLELRCLAGFMARYDGGAYITTVLEGKKEDGTDSHSTNARAIGLDPKKTYQIGGQDQTGRDLVKTWFYAFIYGAGDHKLGEILGEGKAAGKRSRQAFSKNLPALGTLVSTVREKIDKPGFLFGKDGRRIYARSKHSALNTLLQGTGAVLMKKALVILDQDLQIGKGLQPGIDYEFVANVHDEWQIEVMDASKADDVGIAACEAIRKAGEHYEFACPLSGSYEVGQTWAETH